MKNILKIASIVMLIVGIWFIHDVMDASFLYPGAELKFTKSAIMEYKKNNKVNEEDYKKIENQLDFTMFSYRNECKQYGSLKIYGALCLFTSSLLLFLASRKIKDDIEPSASGNGVPPSP